MLREIRVERLIAVAPLGGRRGGREDHPSGTLIPFTYISPILLHLHTSRWWISRRMVPQWIIVGCGYSTASITQRVWAGNDIVQYIINSANIDGVC